jgi:glutamate-ammonia-ligase adenylyltransferase
VADAVRNAWTAIVARVVLLSSSDGVGERLSQLAERTIAYMARRCQAGFDIVALGSFGYQNMAISSDCDLLLLVREKSEHPKAEAQAQTFLSMAGQLRRYGVPFSLDLRLRPEGKDGLLVRTFEGFSAYELESMEMWERFALGPARLIFGDESSAALCRKAAYAQPLTPERLKDLIAMKRRIEAERVPPQNLRRDVKLGFGGLSDIEWLIHLLEMRYPSASHAIQVKTFGERLRDLSRARLITAVEEEELSAARGHLLDVRIRLALLGVANDTIPENPDKLARLAKACGLEDGNAFLARHEHVTDRVRAIFDETLERLRA